MTGAYGEVNVADGVTEPQTLNTTTPVNRAQLSVQRVAARVLVTADQASYEIKGDDPTTPGVVETVADGNAVPLVTITDLTYVVAQGESSFYFDQQKSGNTNYEYKTPNSTYVPVGALPIPVRTTTCPLLTISTTTRVSGVTRPTSLVVATL